MTQRRRIGVFGGTFDPVHYGHLCMARELKRHFQLDEMRLVPCHIPPHRDTPIATPEQRLAMLRLAVAESEELTIDTLELENSEPSYSLHTLQMLRSQLGGDVSLALAIGMDSLASLNSWFEWRRLLEFGHLIVAARPGWQCPSAGELGEYIAQHLGTVDDVQQSSHGKIVVVELSLLPVSATQIRAAIGQGEEIKELVPEPVRRYIREHSLYAVAPSASAVGALAL